MSDKAYCECLRNRVQGWTKLGEDWVCTKCRKPSRLWMEKIYMPRFLKEHTGK